MHLETLDCIGMSMDCPQSSSIKDKDRFVFFCGPKKIGKHAAILYNRAIFLTMTCMTYALPTQITDLTDDHIKAYLDAAQNALQTDDIYKVRQVFLGKKSPLAHLSKQMGALAVQDKKTLGDRLHLIRTQLTELIDETQRTQDAIRLQEALQASKVDVTLPARPRPRGSLHPVTLTTKKMTDFFHHLGFDIETGPEIESDFYNFEALNIPASHPARAMHDTFYFDATRLLRTHTSPVQIRAMQNARQDAPLAIICPGRVYRCDSDQTHSPMFHQMEGLFVAPSANFATLKSLILSFLRTFFQADVQVRFRPSFFPFTEPSAEVDILGQNGKWLEVMGCGMVHPNVLAHAGFDPNARAFAFGMGIERFAMLAYEVSDLRLFFQNDQRFLAQFS